MFQYFMSTMLIGAMLSISANLSSQTFYAKDQVTAENLKTTDWFSLNYQYLDNDYNVIMDSITYQNALVKYNLPGLLMNSYTDSVAVAMISEFDDWDIANVAITKVGYSWTKMSYYLWLTPEETKQAAAEYNFRHAYLFRQYISREENNNENVIKLLDGIKSMLDANNLTEYNTDSRTEFLSYAFKHNPDKITFYTQKRAKKKHLMQQYKERHSAIDRMKIGVGCSEADCCQKISSTMP